MKTMNRRRFLRGMLGGSAVMVGLPLLDIMLNPHGEALADGTDLPDRFGVWFWGNGIKPDRWVPSTTGRGWTPSPELAPLAGVQDYVSVVTGCELKTANHPHHSGMTGILTGQRYHQLGTTRDTIVTTFARQSVDMDAADHFDGLSPYRSLEVGVTRFRGSDEGSTFQHLSHNGPNNPNPSEYTPSALYRRLFQLPDDPQRDPVRKSVLDVVGDQTRALQRDLGRTDRIRLEQHLDSIRQLEQRLGGAYGSCGLVDDPGSFPDVNGQEPIAEKNQAMSDLLAMALACDLTRVFSVQFSTCGSQAIFWPVGATDPQHSLSHNEPNPQHTIHDTVIFTMGMLARFLETLRDMPEGDGNLLDRCSILCTSELSDGQFHSNRDYQLLIAGKGSGRLRGGVHYRSTTRENTSDVVLTALRGAGVPLSGWGERDGYTESVISALLT
ncbi:MAG: DUF1552 domain-containing protein [Myxococcota bacterium]